MKQQPIKTEYDYATLLSYTYKFIYGNRLNLDPRDLAHDLIASNRLGTASLLSLCTELVKGELSKESPLSLFGTAVLGLQYTFSIEYKYCYTCEDILPTYLFSNGSGFLNKECTRCWERKRSHTPKRKEQVARNKKTQREELRDSYIIALLQLNGYTKEVITSRMIQNKRNALLEKRMRKQSKTKV
jgi:hypothetical protein